MNHQSLTNFSSEDSHHSYHSCPYSTPRIRIGREELVSVLNYFGHVEERVRGSCLRSCDRVPYNGCVFKMRGPRAPADSDIVLWKVGQCN